MPEPFSGESNLAPTVTRLAPSPTGSLHLGNAWAFLLAWLAARQKGGQVLLRLDDIDPGRCRPELASAILADLRWLGLDWDEPVIRQSERQQDYQRAIDRLRQTGYLYPCFCSRRELRHIASAPHLDQPIYAYSGKCARLAPQEREALISQGRQYSLRFRCPANPVAFTDVIQGRQEFSPAAYGGDFIVKRADHVWAYQLATVIDDSACGVNLVLRGRDLLPSTPPQMLLLQALGHPTPAYAHIPLLLNADGQRLAKRHAALSLAVLRQQGISPRAIIGLLGKLATGRISPESIPRATPQELLIRFRMEAVPKNDITISAHMLQALAEA